MVEDSRKQLNNASNTTLSDLIHDELNVNELIHLNKSIHNDYTISTNLIYKIGSLLEKEIEQIENFDNC